MPVCGFLILLPNPLYQKEPVPFQDPTGVLYPLPGIRRCPQRLIAEPALPACPRFASVAVIKHQPKPVWGRKGFT